MGSRWKDGWVMGGTTDGWMDECWMGASWVSVWVGDWNAMSQ